MEYSAKDKDGVMVHSDTFAITTEGYGTLTIYYRIYEDFSEVTLPVAFPHGNTYDYELSWDGNSTHRISFTDDRQHEIRCLLGVRPLTQDACNRRTN